MQSALGRSMPRETIKKLAVAPGCGYESGTRRRVEAKRRSVRAACIRAAETATATLVECQLGAKLRLVPAQHAEGVPQSKSRLCRCARAVNGLVSQVNAADWATPADVKRAIRSASILKDGRVVFNLAGNKYRLVAWINYPYRVVYIRFIGTHRQYDMIDAQKV
jgi:mRNA interferase HigB